jgi:hypothetical protein
MKKWQRPQFPAAGQGGPPQVCEHCQHDNPTLGQGLMLDWLADKFGIDQTTLLKP